MIPLAGAIIFFLIYDSALKLTTFPIFRYYSVLFYRKPLGSRSSYLKLRKHKNKHVLVLFNEANTCFLLPPSLGLYAMLSDWKIPQVVFTILKQNLVKTRFTKYLTVFKINANQINVSIISTNPANYSSLVKCGRLRALPQFVHIFSVHFIWQTLIFKILAQYEYLCTDLLHSYLGIKDLLKVILLF